MTLELALSVALALSATQASGDEDCILGLEAIRGQLDHAAREVTTVESPVRVGRRLSEAIRLGDGTVVRFETGGCVHYGFSFSYSGIPLTDRRFASVAATTRALLERTPVKDDAKGNLEILIRALAAPEDTPSAPGETYLSCGDAVCSLRVTPEPDADAVTVTVSYDFPL